MRTLKSLLIASAAVLTLSAPVLAADAIQEQPPVPAPVEYAPQYSWAGGYTGLYLGYGWNKNKLRTDEDAGNIKPNGVKAGAYAGWNFQQDNIVYGVEGDAGYNWGKKTIDGLQAKQGFEGSLRGRVGIALDPIMPYITAGIAGSQVKLAVDDDSVSKFRVGWTAGVGTEAKLTENIIGRVEYRYTAFGGKDYNFDAGVVNSKLQSHDVRIGVGYKF